jgi:hypothetical protein
LGGWDDRALISPEGRRIVAIVITSDRSWCRASRRAAVAFRVVAGLCLAALAGGCAARAADAPPPGQTARYTDPFQYCAAVGTVDKPDTRYVGPAVPASIAAGLRRAFDAPPDAPLEPFTRGTSWRCMSGKVYACNVGANLPCDAKADVRTTPSAPITQFCRQNADADVVPMVVTGRDTVYEWRCRGGAPVVVRQFTQPDARGYLSNIWYELTPPR